MLFFCTFSKILKFHFWLNWLKLTKCWLKYFRSIRNLLWMFFIFWIMIIIDHISKIEKNIWWYRPPCNLLKPPPTTNNPPIAKILPIGFSVTENLYCFSKFKLIFYTFTLIFQYNASVWNGSCICETFRTSFQSKRWNFWRNFSHFRRSPLIRNHPNILL